MNLNPVTVVGEVFLDILMSEGSAQEPSMRLGGAVHAARTLWAMGAEYHFLALLPEYLEAQAEDYMTVHGAASFTVLGRVSGCPLVMIAQRRREVGGQGYEFLLRDRYQVEWQPHGLEILQRREAKHVLVLGGSYDIRPLFEEVPMPDGCLHVDFANLPIDKLASQRVAATTYITSTSGSDFDFHRSQLAGDGSSVVQRLVGQAAQAPAEYLLLKENRGGARLFSCVSGAELVRAPAQLFPIVHSVGVGDCYDAAFVALQELNDSAAAMTYASWIAAQYATTMYVDDFREAVQGLLNQRPEVVKTRVGCSLPWEERSAFKVYVAGADFSYRNTDDIDAVAEALQYHNFSPIRPVKECGEAATGSSSGRKRAILACDLALLREASALIAVITEGDPGTYAEIGVAFQGNLPVLIYDPLHRLQNLFAEGLACSKTDDLGEVIDWVFRIASES